MHTKRHDRPMRILMLHGHGQSPDLFRMKTRSLTEAIETSTHNHVEFIYPCGPYPVYASKKSTGRTSSSRKPSGRSDHATTPSGYAWWRGDLDLTNTSVAISEGHFRGAYNHLAYLLSTHAPIDGVIGSSSGACMAMLLASICDATSERALSLILQRCPVPLTITPRQGPLKFVVSIDGFKLDPALYGGFYDPPIATPTILVRGAQDSVVSESATHALYYACADAKLLSHEGASLAPNEAVEDAVTNLINRTCFPSHRSSPARQWMTPHSYHDVSTGSPVSKSASVSSRPLNDHVKRYRIPILSASW